MHNFDYFLPTRIIFGAGKFKELGKTTKTYGRRALLVTGPVSPRNEDLYHRAKKDLNHAGVEVEHFSGVLPNPTTDVVREGAQAGIRFQADVVVGIGGGSSMDTAKAIAVEASHPGTAWDYLFYKKEPTAKTLPIVVVSTTSGTGSQTTPCAVITRPEDKDKSALWHERLFPRAAIVDPELPETMPSALTARTGFDAFSHNFEALISVNSNPMVEALALSGMEKIAAFLPRAVARGTHRQAREVMSWADTLGGMAISSGGVTLPHGLGMQIGGHCPQVAHGEALALLYPAFMRFTWKKAVPSFAKAAGILDPSLKDLQEEEAPPAPGGKW